MKVDIHNFRAYFQFIKQAKAKKKFDSLFLILDRRLGRRAKMDYLEAFNEDIQELEITVHHQDVYDMVQSLPNLEMLPSNVKI